MLATDPMARASVTTPARAPTGRFRWTPRRQRAAWAYIFVSLPLLGLLIFFVGPILFSLWVSLHDWNMITPVARMKWRGLDNYAYLLLQDALFRRALANTFLFALGGVSVNVVVGLGIALLLNQPIRAKALWRVLYFLPVMTAPLALGVLFGFLFNRNYGLINSLLVALGLPRQPFLADPDQALMAIVFIAIYQYVGYYVVIYLAGLQGIPQDFYDAANVDGANGLQRLRYITLPLLQPVTLFVVVTNTIGALQVFDLVYATTGGGPANRTLSVVLYMYDTAFKFSRMGRASAMAFLLFLIILAITIVQLRLLRDRTRS
jgi:multiple sugar transport system permease protein